jgi:hypothetical protein
MICVFSGFRFWWPPPSGHSTGFVPIGRLTGRAGDGWPMGFPGDPFVTAPLTAIAVHHDFDSGHGVSIFLQKDTRQARILLTYIYSFVSRSRKSTEKQLARRSDKRRALRMSSRQRMVLDRRGAPLLSFDDLKAYRSRIRARLGYGSTHACCRTYCISSESDRARIAVVSRGLMPVLLDEGQFFRGPPVDRLHPLR